MALRYDGPLSTSSYTATLLSPQEAIQDRWAFHCLTFSVWLAPGTSLYVKETVPHSLDEERTFFEWKSVPKDVLWNTVCLFMTIQMEIMNGLYN